MTFLVCLFPRRSTTAAAVTANYITGRHATAMEGAFSASRTVAAVSAHELILKSFFNLGGGVSTRIRDANFDLSLFLKSEDSGSGKLESRARLSYATAPVQEYLMEFWKCHALADR